VTVVRAGFKMSHGDPAAATPPPMLGEHTDEVLGGLGYSPAEIDALRKAGAL
jgi:CoA:oxalate CoA-transferase